jgi:hypothetical protein
MRYRIKPCKGEIMDYTEAGNKLATARAADRGKPLQNNTRLFKRGDNYAVRLHQTDVVTIHRDGSYTLDSGGWLTVTTKDRINGYAPCQVWSEKGIWYVSYCDGRYLYADGMRLLANGKVEGAKTAEKSKAALKEQKQLRKDAAEYAKEYIRKLFAGEIPAPSGGDCWLCCLVGSDGKGMGDNDPNHMKEHLKEPYYVPTILKRAMDDFGVSRFAKSVVGLIWTGGEIEEYMGGIAAEQLEKAVKRYCLRRLGMAA